MRCPAGCPPSVLRGDVQRGKQQRPQRPESAAASAWHGAMAESNGTPAAAAPRGAARFFARAWTSQVKESSVGRNLRDAQNGILLCGWWLGELTRRRLWWVAAHACMRCQCHALQVPRRAERARRNWSGKWHGWTDSREEAIPHPGACFCTCMQQ